MKFRFALAAAALLFLASSFSLNATTSTRLSGFIANQGQWPSDVLYMVRQNGANVWIKTSDVMIQPTVESVNDGRITTVGYGATGTFATKSVGAQTATFSYFIGNDPSAWRTVPVFESVDISDGKLTTVQLRLDDKGHVSPTVLIGETVQAVTITTSIVYGTYVGANEDDKSAGLESQPNGDVIFVGTTASMQYPNVTGGYSLNSAGAKDGFIIRFDPKLQRIKAYTLIGGVSDDKIKGVTRDAQNNLYIVGETTSNNFPVTAGVTGQLYKAQIDGFVASLDSNMTKLLMSTYLGGNKDDMPMDVKVDAAQVVYVCGGTTSTQNFPANFPVTITYRDWRGRETTQPGGGANLGQTDGFVASISATGRIIQCRYFGREGVESFTSLALDASSGVYVTGSTTSSNFETAPTPDRFTSGRLPYDRTFNGGNTDAFVVKFNNELALAKTDDGTYSTYFGGSGDEEGRGIFIDALGRAYVVGVTTSPNLPAVGTLQTTPIGQKDIFLTVLSDDGRELGSCTYFGGSADDDVLGAKSFNGLNTAVMYGSTLSSDFPALGPGSVGTRTGASDAYFAVINTFANVYTTLVSGSADETITAALVDAKGDLYYSAETSSPDLKTYDSSFADGTHGANLYVAKHAFGTLELTTPRGGESWCVGSNQTISWQTAGMQSNEKYVIEISKDAGNTWTLLAKDIIANNHQWKPSVTTTPPGDEYQIRILTSRGHISQCSDFSFVTPPAITTQPIATSGCAGAHVTLSVAATGGNLKYQWRKNAQNINGATTATYDIPSLAAANAGTYDVVVSGKCSPTVTSAGAAVSVAQPTAITTQPTSVTVEAMQPITLTVVATGGSLTYQWAKNNYDISGATAATYSVTSAGAADIGTYKCKVTGTCGEATTNEVEVKVNNINGVKEDLWNATSSLKLIGPNPSSSEVTVGVNFGMPSLAWFRVLDQQGSIVWTSQGTYYPEGNAQIQIPVSQLTSGNYAIEVRTEYGSMHTTCTVLR